MQEKTLCRDPIANCATHATSGSNLTCTECDNTFALYDTSLKCGSIPANCTGLDNGESTIRCTTCDLGYTVNPLSFRCVITTPDCQTYEDHTGSSTSRLCEICSSGFILYDSQNPGHCVADIAQCSSYSFSASPARHALCDTCHSTYQTTTDKKKCLPEIVDCDTYSTSDENTSALTCSSCSGSKITTDSQLHCVNPITNCTGYQTITTTEVLCSTCDSNTVLVHDKTLCKAKIQNCSNHATTGNALTCGTCETNYDQYDSSLKCGLLPASCTDLDNSSSVLKCLTCASGFDHYDSSTKCGSLPANCIDLNDSLASVQCSACDSGFALNNLNFECLITTDNCDLFETLVSASVSKLCTSCSTGFILYETTNPGHCVAEVENCASHTFHLDTPRYALCQTCNSNHTLTADKKKCLSSIEHCTEYETSSELNTGLECKVCSGSKIPTDDKLACVDSIANCTGYQTITTSSILCSTCDSTTVLVQDKTQCKTKIVNCATHATTGNNLTCSTCESTFDQYDSSLKCGLLPGNCTDLDNSSSTIKCLTCASGFDQYDSSTKCGLLPGNCTNLDDAASTVSCLTCQATFDQYDSSTKCGSLPSKCTDLNNAVSTIQCSACETGYALNNSNFNCLVTTENCDTFETQNSVSTSKLCTNCSSTFRLFEGTSPGYCVEEISECANYSYSSTPSRHALCESCNPNFHHTTNKKFCLSAISNCDTYTVDSINDSTNAFLECEVCASGFLGTPDKLKCLAELPNCAYYKTLANSDASATCIECSENYHLSSSNGCVFDYNSCGGYNASSGVCSSCASDYFHASSNGNCYSSRHRIVCGDSTNGTLKTNWPHSTCASCASGKSLSLLEECYTNENSVTDCSLFKSKAAFLQESSSKCLACGRGKLPNTQLGKCLAPISDCWEYEDTASNDFGFSCRACVQSKKLSSNGSSCDDFTFDDSRFRCLTGQTFACSSCAIGAVQQKNPSNFSQNVCYPLIEGCLEYLPSFTGQDLNPRCTQCASGLTLSKGRCSGVSGTVWENCLDMSSTSTCNVCNLGYSKDNGKCVKRTDLGPTVSFEVKNTSQLVHPSACSFADYTIQTILEEDSNSNREICINPKCSKFKASTGACLECNADSCGSCSSGQYNLVPVQLSDNSYQCLQDVNCKIFNSNGSCSECQIGFINASSGCTTKDIIYNTLSNCRVRTSTLAPNVTCVQCNENYEISGGLCVYKNTECQKIGSCSSCRSGYQTSVSNDYSTCAPVVANCRAMKSGSSTQCQACKDGYELTSSDTVCSIKSANQTSFPNCVKFYTNSSTDLCIECATGFLFLDFMNQCVSKVPYCTSYSDADTCSGCADGYSPSNGDCVSTIPNCLEYSDASNCSRCETGFSIINNASTGNNNHCTKTDAMLGCLDIWDSSHCFKCKTGFVMKNNVCVPSMSASTFSSGGKCSDDAHCKTGYTCDSGSGECRPGDCSASNDTHASKCKTCATNYQLISANGRCENKLENCATPSSTTVGSCSTCATGFSKKT
ncbi:MAG: hypothetical protein AAFO91_00040 [Bacteroidota bacterium]